MKINRNNYEKYVIDYLENNLDTQTRKKFERFLEKNPDIKAEIEDLNHWETLPVDTEITFPQKIDLKKSSIDGLSYFDELCIADVENIITPEQYQELQRIIASDKEKRKIYEQYKATKLHPPAISYPYKARLKRFAWQHTVYNIISIAAAIIITLSIINLGYKTTTKQAAPALSAKEIKFEQVELPQPPAHTKKHSTFLAQPTYKISQLYKEQPQGTSNLTENITKSLKQKLPNIDTSLIQEPIVAQQLLINQPINPEIHLIDTNAIYFNRNNLNMELETLKLVFMQKLKEFSKKRGIIIDRKRILFTVKDKVYGIALSK